MRKNYFKSILCSLFLVAFSVNAQVGIGTTVPDNSAELDVTSTNRGFLMPRVALTSTLDVATITGAEATGLLVYNTATIADVVPGFYYWNGTQWVALGGGSAIAGWELLGNLGTNAAINFVGTRDAQNLVFRTNNTQVMSVTVPDGNNDTQVVMGTASSWGTEALPMITFNGDTNTGIWSDGADEFSLGGGAQEFLTVAAGPDELIVNEDGDDIDFRVEGDTDVNNFVVDAANNVVGVKGYPVAPFVLGVPINATYYPWEIGSDGNTGTQISVAYYRASDVTLNPETGGNGYVGYYNNPPGPTLDDDAWGEMNAYSFINPSSEEIKRGINVINQDKQVEDYLMNDIMSIKPSLYNYNRETDRMQPGFENRYRPAYRLGLIVEDTPDYLLSNNFSGVDIYAVATLSLAGVQRNMKEINEMKQPKVIQDFGSIQMKGDAVWVSFSENFNGSIPVVTISSMDKNAALYISNKTTEGFEIRSSNGSLNSTFDWIAMAKNPDSKNGSPASNLNASIKNKLEVPANEKQQIINYYSNLKSSLHSQAVKN